MKEIDKEQKAKKPEVGKKRDKKEKSKWLQRMKFHRKWKGEKIVTEPKLKEYICREGKEDFRMVAEKWKSKGKKRGKRRRGKKAIRIITPVRRKGDTLTTIDTRQLTHPSTKYSSNNKPE